MRKKYAPRPGQVRGKARPGADVFTAFGAILSWNARHEYWTVRRGGQIVGTEKELEAAMTIARETVARETAQKGTTDG
jgi:hypothetical protein